LVRLSRPKVPNLVRIVGALNLVALSLVVGNKRWRINEVCFARRKA
jgi:hypothetical protein